MTSSLVLPTPVPRIHRRLTVAVVRDELFALQPRIKVRSSIDWPSIKNTTAPGIVIEKGNIQRYNPPSRIDTTFVRDPEGNVVRTHYAPPANEVAGLTSTFTWKGSCVIP